ncbi:DEAD/DEAH box helicase [Kamptonema cortianum]|nr:DEAD/DEAH box helicase [Geitlerinema splendidum]MDK3161030.1 DEAD/DEAH box helicase [Kamptonema cortianum]
MHASSLRSLVESRGGSVHVIPPRIADFSQPTLKLHHDLNSWLSDAGIKTFYSHQVEAWMESAFQKDILVVTGTSSGKSLCYNVPVLQDCLTEPVARALYIFPTKALAQDQLQKLTNLIKDDSILCATYDGDTPKNLRTAARNSANIVLTNPDMLHLGILPQHELWGKFLRGLRTIVIDEAHIYRGVFGGHLAWILRRLLRLCHWYGSYPRIIACSATIGNPEALLPSLTGRSATVIDRDGSPSGSKAIFMVPSSFEEPDPISPNRATADLLVEAIESHQRVLAFCRSRNGVELVLNHARKRLTALGLSENIVDSYRGGYSAEERRSIEEAVFRGDLLGLVSTNAMELGVDIGGLDVVILNGYPGRISSFWQQVGRAGRSGSDGSAIYLAHADPMEQFLALNPKFLLDTKNEKVFASIQNPYIAAAQVQCAAYERPISEDEAIAWQNEGLVNLEDCVNQGLVERNLDRYFYPSHTSPAAKVNIRGTREGTVQLLHENQMVGEMELWRAMQYAHVGAIYLHRGSQYESISLNIDEHVANVMPVQVDFFTVPVVQSLLDSLYEVKSRSIGRVGVAVHSVRVTTAVTGYRKVSSDGRTTISEHELKLPPQTLDTIGLRLTFDPSIIQPELSDDLKALHSLEHVLSSLAPVKVNCDRSDLGSAWFALDPATQCPSIYLFDMAMGGIGLSESLFEIIEELLLDCKQLLQECDCDNGCPLCLMSHRCESNNELIGKREALHLLTAISASPG